MPDLFGSTKSFYLVFAYIDCAFIKSDWLNVTGMMKRKWVRDRQIYWARKEFSYRAAGHIKTSKLKQVDTKETKIILHVIEQEFLNTHYPKISHFHVRSCPRNSPVPRYQVFPGNIFFIPDYFNYYWKCNFHLTLLYWLVRWSVGWVVCLS